MFYNQPAYSHLKRQNQEPWCSKCVPSICHYTSIYTVNCIRCIIVVVSLVQDTVCRSNDMLGKTCEKEVTMIMNSLKWFNQRQSATIQIVFVCLGNILTKSNMNGKNKNEGNSVNLNKSWKHINHTETTNTTIARIKKNETKQKTKQNNQTQQK